MIHGIGVDLLHIPRLARLLTKSYGAAGLPRRILTFAERDAYRRLTTHDARVSYLSTRWALKEAAWKASRPYVSSWQDCAVHHDRTGAPVLVVDGDKVPLGFACSVSHDGAYCVAYVVTTTRPGPDEPISLKDKRGTGEMIEEHERDVPRHHEKADAWISKW